MDLKDLAGKYVNKETAAVAADKAKEVVKAVGEKAKEEIGKALKDLPGAAIDAADQDKVDKTLVRERTATLNNNPRNNDQ